jgi:flagellar biosynthesis protein FliR
MTLDLGQLLAGEVFAFMLIFARLSSAIMLFPGIGETFVSPRVRLLFALMFTALVLPMVAPSLPKMPNEPAQIVLLLAGEILVGLFFGTILRLLLSALEVGGTIISMQIGLSNASIFNPTLATQGTLTGALLGTIAIVIIFASGMETLLLRGLVGTYETFVPGQNMMLGDIYGTVLKTVSRSFALGAEISAPFLVVGVMLSIAFGIISRLMPQIQIFALSMPLMIGAGLALFGLTLTASMLYWLQQFGDTLQTLGWN